MSFVLDAEARIGTVHLSVADLARSLTFYQQRIGLSLLEQSAGAAVLGVAGMPLLRLTEQPGARLVRRATGLYHFALRVPTRPDLAAVLNHLLAEATPISGAADHLFSEALYLDDPDGHGIEIYRDRPRDQWQTDPMPLVSDPLDSAGIMAELDLAQPWQGLPASTDMGHIHLQVASIPASERFYQSALGMDRMMGLSSASFVSAGGYHHHIGMNTWAGVGVPVPPPGAARLLDYEVQLPSTGALMALLDNLSASEVPILEQETGYVVRDPASNTLRLTTRT